MSFVFVFQGSRRFIKKRKHCLQNNSKVFFLLGTDASNEIYSLAKENGWDPIDTSKGNSWTQENILEEYLDLIASFSQWNAETLHWWATYFSSKFCLTSPFFPYFQELHQSLFAIENLKRDESLVLLNISWPVVETLQSLSFKEGYHFKVYSPFFSKLGDLSKAKFYYWKRFFKEIVFSFFSIWKAKRAFGKPHEINSKTPVCLIKSFTYLKSFKEDLYEDPFFGRLPNYLRKQFPNQTVLTLALGIEDRVECYQKMKKLSDSLVQPMEIYLTYWDVLKRSLQWLWRIIFHPIQIKGRLFWLGHEITPFFLELISFGGFYITFFHTLHFDLAKRLGKKFQIQICLMTYEGRPWERFFIAGLQKANRSTDIIGCQHTVIPFAEAGMFLHRLEKDLIPLPDKIVTTGMIPKKILERYGSYPKEQIEVGCALRYETLQDLSLLKCRKESKKNFVLLVAFGGSEDEIPLLNYVLGQALLNKESVFRMRAHPAFSLDRLMLLSSWGETLPENVEKSTFSEVLEDLKSCDAVLYWGTTVALEALMVGKPIIHFDRGDLLSFDPLFEFADFKWQVQQKDLLKSVIQDIQALPETQYCEYQKQGRAYTEQYFSPVTKENLDKFLFN